MQIREGDGYPILQFVSYGRWVDLSESESLAIREIIYKTKSQYKEDN